jgi:tetrapyrrole methylase family protein/MazG family protein
MGKEFDRLVEIVARLRGPGGCPWDREQTHQTILSGLLDESYEFFEAVQNKDDLHMKEELGDILLQVVFHAQMAAEEKKYTAEDVAHDICEKLIRRHPHVFGDTTASSTGEVLKNWEEIKKNEKGNAERISLVDGIPDTLPALFKAEKMQHRVARVGFDWQDIKPVLDKVEEEFREFREAIFHNDIGHATGELGDILFALVNVGRHHNICAEEALRMTVSKFSRRFRYIEDQCAAKNIPLKEAGLPLLDEFWEQSKKVVG